MGSYKNLRYAYSAFRIVWDKATEVFCCMMHMQRLHVHSVVYSMAHTHTHPFNSPLSGTTRVSRYQKGKTSLDFTEARDSEWQWHQLSRVQVCTDKHASTPPLSFFTGRMPFLLPNQQCQEGHPACKKLIGVGCWRVYLSYTHITDKQCQKCRRELLSINPSEEIPWKHNACGPGYWIDIIQYVILSVCLYLRSCVLG